MSQYLGDFVEDATVHFQWDTFDSSGASITRATNGTISVYKDNGVTQSTAGITDTEDFDTLTGIHACTIDTSADAFYTTGSNYSVVLSAATIDGQTVNAVLAHFSIENRSALRPTTAGRTLDVAATGEAGVDLDNTNGALGTSDFDADFLDDTLIATDAIDAAAIAAAAVTKITDDIFAELIETIATAGQDITFKQHCRGVGAYAYGRSSGMDTGTGTLSTPNNGTTRIQATLDGNGNRTGMTLTL